MRAMFVGMILKYIFDTKTRQIITQRTPCHGEECYGSASVYARMSEPPANTEQKGCWEVFFFITNFKN